MRMNLSDDECLLAFEYINRIKLFVLINEKVGSSFYHLKENKSIIPHFYAHLSVSLNVCVTFTTHSIVNQLYMNVSAPCTVFMLILRASLSESLSSFLTQTQRQICPPACHLHVWHTHIPKSGLKNVSLTSNYYFFLLSSGSGLIKPGQSCFICHSKQNVRHRGLEANRGQHGQGQDRED